MARGVLPALWALPWGEDMARSGKFGFNEIQQEGYPNELRPAITHSGKPALMTHHGPGFPRILGSAPRNEYQQHGFETG